MHSPTMHFISPCPTVVSGTKKLSQFQRVLVLWWSGAGATMLRFLQSWVRE